MIGCPSFALQCRMVVASVGLRRDGMCCGNKLFCIFVWYIVVVVDSLLFFILSFQHSRLDGDQLLIFLFFFFLFSLVVKVILMIVVL